MARVFLNKGLNERWINTIPFIKLKRNFLIGVHKLIPKC